MNYLKADILEEMRQGNFEVAKELQDIRNDKIVEIEGSVPLREVFKWKSNDVFEYERIEVQCKGCGKLITRIKHRHDGKCFDCKLADIRKRRGR